MQSDNKIRYRIFSLLLICILLPVISFSSYANTYKKKDLHFKRNKTFKIVQFTDIQDDQEIDPRTVKLIETVLDDQKPNLVVFSGDNIQSNIKTTDDVTKAIDNFVEPVENRKIPWFITFGNHDDEHAPLTNMDKDAQLDYYMTFQYNINQVGTSGVYGTGNMHFFIRASRSNRPVFGIWALDSGPYIPDDDTEHTVDELDKLEWDRLGQVSWYVTQSKALEKLYHKKTPSFMFFHVPLIEFDYMWNGGDKYAVKGERNEDVCSGSFNSGLFDAVHERGDVKGIFVGHDHINTFEGNYKGIYLGYTPSAGFGTYGLGGEDNNRLRGVRVFLLDEKHPKKFKTYMVYAKDYGIQ